MKVPVHTAIPRYDTVKPYLEDVKTAVDTSHMSSTCTEQLNNDTIQYVGVMPCARSPHRKSCLVRHVAIRVSFAYYCMPGLLVSCL